MDKFSVMFVTFFLSVFLIFSIPTVNAEAPSSNQGTNATAYIVKELAAGKTEEFILRSLIAPTYSMALQEAADAIIRAKGNMTDVMAAAIKIYPDFKYSTDDPTASLDPSASGGSTGGGSQGSSGGGPQKSLGGGGQALDGA